MIRHMDFDNHKETVINNAKLPDGIDHIEFSYDGGRVEISINGRIIYKTSSGTQDCSIEIDNL